MLKENFSLSKINYVLDTSVLISNPNLFQSFKDCEIIIPMKVLEELDNLKIRDDYVGKNARFINRYLDSIREYGNLMKGITIDNDVLIKVLPDSKTLLSFFEETNDNKIISIAYKLNKTKNVVCLSNDIGFRVKCDALGLKAEGLYTENFILADGEYTGLTTLKVSQEIINELFESKELYFEDISFYPNQGVLLESEKSSALAIAFGQKILKPLEYTKGKKFNVEGIYPRNKEQTLALELLLNPEIPLVTLNGIAGCGKTLLTIASAMKQLNEGTCKKIIISRPIESTSKDIGFLPGTKEEKMAPWVQPIFDNLEIIYRKKGMNYLEMMINKGLIEIEAISHIRGRSLPDTIFIVDEAQNISKHEAKALLTRMGENSKIILIGDLEQIDSSKLNYGNSGLSVIIEAFKSTELAGHIKLIKGERSRLATYAAKIL